MVFSEDEKRVIARLERGEVFTYAYIEAEGTLYQWSDGEQCSAEVVRGLVYRGWLVPKVVNHRPRYVLSEAYRVCTKQQTLIAEARVALARSGAHDDYDETLAALEAATE